MAEGGFIAGSIIAKLLLDNTGFNTAIKAVDRDTAAMGGKVTNFGKKFDEIGGKMRGAGLSLTMFGAALTGAVAGGIASFANFDDAMTQATAIMENLSDAMRSDMVDAARLVAKETTFSSAQAAQAYYYLASAGLSAKDAVAALPAVAQFAQAGMFDLERATELLSDAQSALGLRIRDDAVANMENMVRVSDVLTEANIMANASVEQFSEALTNRAGAALKMVGKDVEEGAAVLAAYADQGIKGSEAGTRLDIVLRDLQTRAIKNKEAFEKYNVTVFDSNGEMRNMADIVRDLEKALEGKSDEQKRMILMEMEFQDRSVASILALMGMSDQIRVYEERLRKAGGTTKEVADNQLESLKSQFTMTKNAVSGLATSFVEPLKPVLMDFQKIIQKITQSVSDFNRKHPEMAAMLSGMTGGFGLLFTIIGGGLFVFGSMMGAVVNITKIFPGFLGLLKGMVPVLLQIGAAWAAWNIGWKVGRWIGETFGLDKAYQKLFGSVLNLVGAYNGMNVEWKQGHIDAQKTSTLALAEATKINGKEVKTLHEAVGILKDKYQEAGTTGNNALDTWIQKFIKVKTTTTETKPSITDLGGAGKDLGKIFEELGIKTKDQLTAELKDAELALSNLKETGQATPGTVKVLEDKIKDLKEQIFGAKTELTAFTEYMKSIGIKTIKEKADRVNELQGFVDKLKEQYKSSKISLQDYNDGVRKASDEAKGLGGVIHSDVLPAQKSMLAEFEKAPGVMEQTELSFYDLSTGIRFFSNEWKVSEATVFQVFWNIQARFLGMMGIIIPRFDDIPDKVETITTETENYFAGLFTEIAQGFGDTLQEWLTGATTFAEMLKGIWGNIKDAFFNMVGEMITKWVKGFLEETLLKKTAGSVSNVGKTFSDMAGAAGKAITGAATSAINVVSGVVTAIASVAALFQKKTGAGDGMGRVVERQDVQTMWLTRLFEDLHGNVIPILIDIRNTGWTNTGPQLNDIKLASWDMRDYLRSAQLKALQNISMNTKGTWDAIGKITGAAKGISTVVRSPRLFLAGEGRVPERVDISPLDQFGGGRQIHTNINFTIQGLDGPSIYAIIRDKVIPELDNRLRHGWKIPAEAIPSGG